MMPAMTPKRVVYTGPAMSGRTTSLAAALRASGSPANALTLNPHASHAFCVAASEVEAMISTARAARFYQSALTAEGLDPKIRWEVDRLIAADGIIFVIDSQEERAEANLLHFERLRNDLAERGVDLDSKPLVLQVNKRDLPNTLPVAALQALLRPRRCTFVESVASRGIGTDEALLALVEMMDR